MHKSFSWIGGIVAPLLLDGTVGLIVVAPMPAVVAQTASIASQKAEADRLLAQGDQLYNASQFEAAIQSCEKALTLYQSTKNLQGEGACLNNLGIAYTALAKYTKAIEYQEQSLAISRKINNIGMQGISLGNLGLVYGYLGNYTKAIEYQQQSLAISRKIKDPQSEVISLGNLGLAYSGLHNYAKAIEYQEQSLAIAQKIEDRYGQAVSLGNLGLAYYYLGNYTKAIEYQEQSLVIARVIKNHQGASASLVNLGLAYYYLGNYAKAIEYQEQSLAIARKINDPYGERIILSALGTSLFRSGNLTQAESTLLSAIEISESLRQGLSDTNKVSIADSQSNPYRTLQQVLIAQNKPAAALETSERGRAKAFLEQISQRLQPNETPNLPTIKIDAIKQIAKAQNATLVEYSQVYNDQLFIWVITPSGQVSFRQVSVKATDLANLVEATREAFSPRRQNAPTQNLQKLHNLLIAPINDLLPTDPNQHVILIPQGPLFLVPFNALQDNQGDYLIQQHTLITAPAIQILALTHQQQQRVRQVNKRNALIVGNPTMPPKVAALPGAQLEAETIAALFQTPAITGAAATKAAIVKQMPEARLIHLATHGFLDEQSGLGSALILAPDGTGKSDDGYLTADEIFNLKLNAELIVLSACNTGGGKITGDGVIGLSRSLITAGTPSVIVSLWSIPDAPTADLMTQFYQNLQQQPDKAQALRQAMLSTLKQHPDPINWAAFTLIGEAQ
jgi:CHAT domain-containing protein/Flp pilus assembly protein TadD